MSSEANPSDLVPTHKSAKLAHAIEAYAALENQKKQRDIMEASLFGFSLLVSTLGEKSILIKNDFVSDVSTVIRTRTSGPALRLSTDTKLYRPGCLANECTVFIDVIPTHPTTAGEELPIALGIEYLFRREYSLNGQVVSVHRELDVLHEMVEEDADIDGGLTWKGWHGPLSLDSLFSDDYGSEFKGFLECWCMFE